MSKAAVFLSPLIRRAIILGLLIAVGAFAVDMYIPGFAAIARDLHTTPGRVQFSMTAYFVAVAAGQIIYGPVSDAIGRRRPIFAGLALFAASSAAAAFAPSIAWLIAARAAQGLGAAATAVIPMAIISDEHTGPAAARQLSLAILALSVSPILAPTFGGLLAQYGSWRLIFVALTLISVAAGLLAARLLPETLPPARRVRTGPVAIFVTYATLLADRRFLIPLLIAGFAQSVLLAFIAGSPFVFVTLHGLKPALYGGLFALHAGALIGISQLNAAIMQAVGVRRLLGWATAMLAAAGIALAILVCAGMTTLWPFLALSITMFASLGLILPPAFLTAVEPFAATAGAAAALGVALELCISSTATFVLGLSADNTARPMVIVMAAAGSAAFGAWIILIRNVAPAPGPHAA
jgi:DHA1 family bicyclomycin/chloramphenicol resistance-like MFS transporter